MATFGVWRLLVLLLVPGAMSHQGNADSKSAYIDAQWKQKMSGNRYASLLMGSATTKAPWTKTAYSYSVNKNNIQEVRLRHSRYPHLDGVMNRLNKMQVTTKVPTTTSRYHYNHDTRNTDKLFYDSYDEDDYKEDVEEPKDDDMPDYDLDNDDEDLDDDEETLDDDTGNWQAEEASETGQSTITEYKWLHYGTRSRVEESRRNQNYVQQSSNSDMSAAINHAVRMNTEARCKQPSPRVLSIQSLHPDPEKSYMPHCTVLHRCAEDTGCCSSHATKCAPKKQVKIYLYFYTTTVGKPGSSVEKLAFYNHTECACLDKSAVPTTLDSSEYEENREVSRAYRSSPSSSSDSSPETIRKCKCPEEYTPILHRGFYCTCGCNEGNTDCLHIKQGNEFFSLKDRMCIHNGQCSTPSCEYGAYMKGAGRCPRKQEKIEAFANQNT